jgi:phospholipid/cholesterol/gamma-HCH transport system substrate-binding protein
VKYWPAREASVDRSRLPPEQTAATDPQPVAAKGGSSVARVAALGGLIAAIALIALVMFGGGGGYRVAAYFQNAGLLVKGDQVQVGGHSVGQITGIDLSNRRQAKITMKITDEDVKPLHVGTTAAIRPTSLPGTASRFVTLQPGPNNAPKIPDGGRIGADRTNSMVELDQVFDSLDPRTRRGLQQVVQGSAAYYAGRSTQLSESIKYLSPALSSTARLTHEVASDRRLFDRFVVDTAGVVNTIAARSGDLSSLVANANAATGAIGDENVALARALDLLPGTLRKANTTFVNLRSTLNDLDPVVNASKPATKRLPQFLSDLRPLVHDAVPTVNDLRALVHTPGPANDLTDLTARFPPLEQQTSTDFPRAVRTLKRAQPVVVAGREYTPELVGWFKDYGQSAASFDANGHFATIFPLLAPFTYSGGQLVASPAGSNRLSGLANQLNRCPGSTVFPPPDRSAPWPVSACDPSAVPPGP